MMSAVIEQLQLAVETLATRLEEPRELLIAPQARQGPTTGPRCYWCSQMGHLERACLAKLNYRRRRRTRRRRRRPRTQHRPRPQTSCEQSRQAGQQPGLATPSGETIAVEAELEWDNEPQVLSLHPFVAAAAPVGPAPVPAPVSAPLIHVPATVPVPEEAPETTDLDWEPMQIQFPDFLPVLQAAAPDTAAPIAAPAVPEVRPADPVTPTNRPAADPPAAAPRTPPIEQPVASTSGSQARKPAAKNSPKATPATPLRRSARLQQQQKVA
nr:hypothetical protein BaRGS_004790 [Batillaria attramentaria]